MKPRRLPKAEQKSLTLTISSLGQQGEGLALHQGKRIYVAGVLAGETVRATLTDQVDRDVFRASVDSIDDKSKDRIDAPCVHYAACGGCVLQHMEEGAYRGWKAGQVRDKLSRAGIEPLHWDDPVFIPQATRRRATFAVVKQGGLLQVGFHGRRSHQIADVDHCLLLHPNIMKARESAKPWLLKLLKDGKVTGLFFQDVDGQVEAVVTGPLARDGGDRVMREAFSDWAAATGLTRVSWQRDVRNEPEIMIQARPLATRFGRLVVALPPGAFLQPSREGEAALTEAVLSFLEDSAYRKSAAIADLFAGSGTFTGPLLGLGPVCAVEFDDSAVNALKAARAGLKLTVEKRNLFTRPLDKSELRRFDAVVLDPPRAGTEAQAAALAKSDMATVVYVSCNPVTFAKDLTALLQEGFTLQRLRVIDQFIWSAHTELVGLFSR